MHQGWRVTGATMGTQAIQAGFLIYAFGTLATAMEPDLGSSRGAIMLAPAFLSVVTNLLFPFAGRVVDRWPAQRLMLVGLAAFMAGGLGLALVSGVWQLYVVFGLLFPLANLFLGQLTASALVARWFQASRGRALGVSATGTSIGGFVFPLLIASLNARLGWRIAVALATAGAALVVALVVLLWVREPPAAAGTARAPPAPWRDIVWQRAFWCETVAVGAGLFCYLGTLANLVPHAVASGLALPDAAALMSVIALTSLCGKLGFGLLADRLDLRVTYALALGAMAAAFLVLAIDQRHAALLGAAILLGLAGGGLLPVWGAMVARSFGAARVGQALGAMNLAMAPLTVAAAPFAGRIFDATGGYRGAFLSYLVILAAGAFALRLLSLNKAS